MLLRMALTKAQRNALMQRLTKGGLLAADCTMGPSEDVLTDPPMPTYAVAHKPTDSVFAFYGPTTKGEWGGYLRSGDDPSTRWRAENWAQVLAFAGKWADETVEWQRTPDLWELGTTLPEATDNSPFTEAERDEIARRLDEILERVQKQFDLTSEQVTAIGQTVQDLKGASRRVGRKDYKVMLYGAFVSLGLEQAVQTGVVEAMLRLAAQALGHLFGGPPPMISA
jgi:hypothetical protein